MCQTTDSSKTTLLEDILIDLIFTKFVMGSGETIIRIFGGEPDHNHFLHFLAAILGIILWLGIFTGIYFFVVWII